jgi:hypothetical protein
VERQEPDPRPEPHLLLDPLAPQQPGVHVPER